MPQDDPGPWASAADAPTDAAAPQAPDRPGDASPPRGLRLLLVPGVNPARWLRVWQERLPHVPVTLVHAAADDAEERLRAGDADAGLLRLPVDRSHLSAIPLYTETTVVVAPTDHVVTAADELVPADLAGEVLLVPDDDVVPWPDRPGEPGALPSPATTAQAVELVAAGAGLLVVPQSLARLHHRRDLTYRPMTDAPTSTIGLCWVTERESELVEELIGIVRGRTVNSSRGRVADRGTAAGTSDAAPGRARATPSGGAGRTGSARIGGRTGGRTGGGTGGKGGTGTRGSGSGRGKSRRPR